MICTKRSLIKQKYGQLVNTDNVVLENDLYILSDNTNKKDVRRIELLINAIDCQKEINELMEVYVLIEHIEVYDLSWIEVIDVFVNKKDVAKDALGCHAN